MELEQLAAVWDRASGDPLFAAELWADPQRVAEAEGFDDDLTAAVVEAIRVGREGLQGGLASWRALRDGVAGGRPQLASLTDDQLAELVEKVARAIPASAQGPTTAELLQWLEALRQEVAFRDLPPPSRVTIEQLVRRLR